MIKYVEGNLITMAQNGEFDIIAHGCNCFCTMGAGIAPQIAKAFPSAEKADNETLKGDPYKLGTWSMGIDEVQGSRKKLRILNLYTQYSTGGQRAVDYAAIKYCFLKIRKTFPETDKIGIPKIGAGLGGGDWDVIEDLIKSVAPKMDITCVIYKP